MAYLYLCTNREDAKIRLPKKSRLGHKGREEKKIRHMILSKEVIKRKVILPGT